MSVVLNGRGKPEIALIIDSETWAFANIAQQLAKNLQPHFDFRIIPSAVISNINQILLMTADCALTHFFWRDFLRLVTQEPAREDALALGFYPVERFQERFVRSRVITTSVYDHLFLEAAEIRVRQTLFRDLIKGYTVCSQRLMGIYQNIADYPAPALLAEDGVDLSLFRPANIGRLDSLDQRTLVVGWAGNSSWARERGADFKGLHTILMPAIRELQAEGLNVRLELADRQQRAIPHADMPQYYAKLDLYVCPSLIEGTPNPVLESMACGVPVISTDVGVVPQAFDGDPFGMILPERSVAALKACIRRHYQGGAARSRQVSARGLQKIRPWDWAHKAENFRHFFERFLTPTADVRSGRPGVVRPTLARPRSANKTGAVDHVSP